MKFLKINKYKNNYLQEIFFLDYFSDFYDFFKYKKNHIKNRKYSKSAKPGVSKNIFKNSEFRDKNTNLIQKFINLDTKKGKKNLINKNINNMLENLFFSLIFYSKEFEFYKNYPDLFYLYNSSFEISSPNKLLKNITLGLESIFEIKTKKNNKKLKLKEKYTHEIVYIPREKRLKYVLRSLNFYKENFKNYNLWERFFWSFFIILSNKENSFLKKRREYIYIKSIKFFKKKKNPLK